MFLITTNDSEDRKLVEKYFISAIEKAFQDNYKHKNKILFLEPYHAEKFMNADFEEKKKLFRKAIPNWLFLESVSLGTRTEKRYAISIWTAV